MFVNRRRIIILYFSFNGRHNLISLILICILRLEIMRSISEIFLNLVEILWFCRRHKYSISMKVRHNLSAYRRWSIIHYAFLNQLNFDFILRITCHILKIILVAIMDSQLGISICFSLGYYILIDIAPKKWISSMHILSYLIILVIIKIHYSIFL